MKFNTKLLLTAAFIALMVPLVFMAGNTGAAGTVWPNVNIWFSPYDLTVDGGWEIRDPACILNPNAQTQFACRQVTYPAFTDQSSCEVQVCADGSAKTAGFCNAAGWSMVNRGTWQNICSVPAYTTQISCLAQAATWTGTCSNPAYTTEASCTSGYNASGNTWLAGGCSDPAYTTASTCTINTWNGSTCSNPAYTTALSCSLATWNGSTCSNPAYTTAGSCTTGAALSNNTWDPTPHCSNPSYTDAISCSTIASGNTWSSACTATWVNGGTTTGAGFYGTLALCSDPAYTNLTSCTTASGDWQQLWTGNYNGGCQRCHGYNRSANSVDFQGRDFPMNAHNNALRKVLPSIPLGGPDWTSSKSTVPAGVRLDQVSSITYNFPDVPGAAPYSTDLSSAEYILGGWYKDIKRAAILRTLGTPAFTGPEPVIMADDTCAECHSTGYVGTFGVKVAPNGTTGGTNKWLYDGVTCGACHSGYPLYGNGSSYSIMETPPLPGDNQAGTQICFACHQQRVAGVVTNPSSGIYVDVASGAFSGYSIGNQFLNSPHAKFTGTAGGVGSPLMYGSAFTNGTTNAYCSNPSYADLASCTTNSGSWGGSCSLPGYGTLVTCTTATGAWTAADTVNNNAGCARCHEPHVGSVEVDTMDPTSSQTNISQHCQGCHTSPYTWNGTTCSNPLYTTASTCTTAGYISATGGNINHSSGPATPMDRVGVPGNNATKAIEFACITCHMGPDLNHLVRINTSAGYSTNPGGSGDVLANTVPDGAYGNAVWNDLDYSCGQCHQDPAKVGADKVFNTAQMSAAAAGMHGGTTGNCIACHFENVATMNHPQPAMFTALTCASCHTAAPHSAGTPGVNPACTQCHGGGTNPIDNPPTPPVYWRSDADLAARAAGIHRSQVDLVVLSVSAPTSAKRGTSITVLDATKNRLFGGAGASSTAVYLSTDTTLDGGDVLLNSRAVPALGPGAVNSGSMAALIPAGTAPGNYYLIWKADNGSVVGETDETNNTKFKAIQVKL